MPQLDKKFWDRFAKTTWEKKSVAIQDIHSPLLQMDASVILDLLVSYSDRCRRSKSADGMKFYIQGHRQFESEVLRHLPKKSDRSLEGYHERMSSQYDDYCLVCDELLQVNNEQEESLEDFTSLLFANVGLPNRFAEMGLYLGNYRKTPFGVHEDACGVFSFPVVGRKRFRIWEPEYVAKNPKLVRAFTYAKHKAASQVLDANVGDMTYWPSSAWHIAESDGSFSVTWSLGVWVDRKQIDVVTEVTTAAVTTALGALGDSRMTKLDVSSAGSPANDSAFLGSGEVKELPQSYAESLAAVASLTEDSLRSVFAEAWLKHLSMRGLKTHPTSELQLRADSSLRLVSSHKPVLWMRDGSTLIYAFNGVVLRSSSKDLESFVLRLNEGRTAKVPRDFKLLQPFARAGAFRPN